MKRCPGRGLEGSCVWEFCPCQLGHTAFHPEAHQISLFKKLMGLNPQPPSFLFLEVGGWG